MRIPLGRATCAAAMALNLWSSPAGARPATSPAGIAFPSDADVHRMLAERVEALAGRDDGIGIVVGRIGPRGRNVVAYGHVDRGDPRPLTGDTGFEIGSIGKLFTALLLTDMVERGEVALDDPVAKCLPAGLSVPARDGRAITLVDLATHTSGLPFAPDTYPVCGDPAAMRAFGTEQLDRYLSRVQLTRDPGAAWDYSNLGYWLLGRALAERGGADLASLLERRVFAPLGLRNTTCGTREGGARRARGHDASLHPAPPLDSVSVLSALGPATGVGVISSANDLLELLAVAMGYERTPLASSAAAMLATRRPMDDGVEQALGWVVIGKGDDRLVTHEGGTLGFASFVAWDPAKRAGVVVLSNQNAPVGDIARHLLRPDVPLERPAGTKHHEVPLGAALLETYAGRYDAEDEGLVSIGLEHGVLRLRPPIGWGLPEFQLRPETPNDFFVAEVPIRVTFRSDSTGRVSGLLIYPPRGQHGIPASRVPLGR